MMKRFVSTRMGAGVAIMVFLAGCTTFSKDGGFGTVSSTADFGDGDQSFRRT
jgi:hypothetical protein